MKVQRREGIEIISPGYKDKIGLDIGRWIKRVDPRQPLLYDLSQKIYAMEKFEISRARDYVNELSDAIETEHGKYRKDKLHIVAPLCYMPEQDGRAFYGSLEEGLESLQGHVGTWKSITRKPGLLERLGHNVMAGTK